MDRAQISTSNDDRHELDNEARLDVSSSQKEGIWLSTYPERRSTKTEKYLTWLRLLWPILLHAILTTMIVLFLLVYVNHRTFNISERRPTVKLHDGTLIRWEFSALLQSDITTLLSVLISVLRLVTSCWLGPLCWRCAFILMEKYGLKPRQLRLLVSYGVPTAPLQGQVKEGKKIRWIMCFILVTTIPLQLAAPVINGSVTWITANHRPHHLLNQSIPVLHYNGDHEQWRLWTDNLGYRRQTGQTAASFDLLTWRWETEHSGLRRYLPGIQLQINNTLTNITLPYFSVRSIEWVSNPQNLMGEGKVNVEDFICSMINVTGELCRQPRYGPILIPGTPWSNQIMPNPLVVSKRQLVVEYVGSRYRYSSRPHGCLYVKEQNKIGPDHAIYVDPAEVCYQFAWVHYTAGISTCYDCLVSSHRTVRNSTFQSVNPDTLTETALRLAPEIVGLVESMMYMEKESVWSSPEDRIVGLLTRSYAASWMALTGALWNVQFNTTYSISAPASQALVDIRRIYMWLGLQFLATLSGLLFTFIQSRSATLVIFDTALTAFYLDTSAVYKADRYHEVPQIRQVELEEDRLWLKDQ
ncbi:hypothetical protein RhiXN_12196 [Rhizoctonia solani]|uniref:Uncharacterized protein n=1 Tax=Rhizoctonia solani TaxID=456999 RepID=A0A8H8P8H7_9AGAM|nr:uncharacterized protein RhiXN_12196 [Rhizoctonia solani]QRW26535.1 hypothetical protein RhiXN_12196 [Rhizoctonia solani]